MNNSASTTPCCGRCGAALAPGTLQGLCPRCLMALNIDTPTDPPPEITAPMAPAPQAADIAPRFPQLEILECLGRGGMGIVYKARQKSLDRLVALKILAPERERDAKFAERFGREAQALARLNHPSIVAVYDYGEAGGLYYLLMEYVEGVTLRQLIRTRRIAPREALAIVPEICAALQFAHDQGIVHRDIKPENVLLDRQGRVKIADFGIAKIMGRTGLGPALTDEQGVIGTPHYMAPEQVEHPAAVDHRADIFSLGVVFYELLTGELPLGKFPPPSCRAHGVEIDVRLDEVVLRALEKEPQRRYQHASEVKTAVEDIAASPAPRNVSAAPGARVAAPGQRPRVAAPASLRDRWLWDPVFAWSFFLVPTFVTSLLVPLLVPWWGLRALLLLLLDGFGLLFALVYTWVGSRVRRLEPSLPADAAAAAEGLLLRRPLQAPGLAVLCPDRLEMRPIVGPTITVPLGDVVRVGETRWFNGTRLWWKRGLMLQLADGSAVGLALAAPVARRWKSVLANEPPPAESAPPTPAARGAAGPPFIRALRVATRILGTLILGFFLLFFIAEGTPPLGRQPVSVQLEFAGEFLMLLGLAVGWRRDGAAAMLILAGWTLFHAVEGQLWPLTFFYLPLVCAALYGLCWWAARGRNGARVLTVILTAQALLLAGILLLPTSVKLRGSVADAVTGGSIVGAQLTLVSADTRAGTPPTEPAARSSDQGRFALFIDWYSSRDSVRIDAPGYQPTVARLGPRPLGRRRLERDFRLQPTAPAAPSGSGTSLPPPPAQPR